MTGPRRKEKGAKTFLKQAYESTLDDAAPARQLDIIIDAHGHAKFTITLVPRRAIDAMRHSSPLVSGARQFYSSCLYDGHADGASASAT